MQKSLLILVLLLPLTMTAAPGQTQAPRKTASPLGSMTLEDLERTLRGQIIQWLPDPLYQASPGWGRTRQVTSGFDWTGRGLGFHAEPRLAPRKDGVWKKVRVAAIDPQRNLTFDLSNLRQPQGGQLLMDAFLAFPVKVYYKHQVWESGLKLYDGHLEAKLRVLLALRVQFTSRLEVKGGLLPDLVFRFRILHADFRYDRFEVEHLGGLGGDAAEILGDLARGTLRRLDPDLEKNLRARANASILKAGDSKEVRIRASQLLPLAAADKTQKATSAGSTPGK